MKSPGDGQCNYGDFDTLFVTIGCVCCRGLWLQLKSAHFHCCSNSYWHDWSLLWFSGNFWKLFLSILWVTATMEMCTLHQPVSTYRDNNTRPIIKLIGAFTTAVLLFFDVFILVLCLFHVCLYHVYRPQTRIRQILLWHRSKEHKEQNTMGQKKKQVNRAIKG